MIKSPIELWFLIVLVKSIVMARESLFAEPSKELGISLRRL